MNMQWCSLETDCTIEFSIPKPPCHPPLPHTFRVDCFISQTPFFLFWVGDAQTTSPYTPDATGDARLCLYTLPCQLTVLPEATPLALIFPFFGCRLIIVNSIGFEFSCDSRIFFPHQVLHSRIAKMH